jgi:hypothetical protein
VLLIPALKRLRWENHKFKASLDYMAYTASKKEKIRERP